MDDIVANSGRAGGNNVVTPSASFIPAVPAVDQAGLAECVDTLIDITMRG